MRQRLWSLIGYLLLLAVVCGAAIPAGAATVVTLDFEDVGVANDAVNFVSTVYNAEGMTLTALPPPHAPSAGAEFYSAGTLSTSFTGSPSLYHHISGGEILLTRTDDRPFHLLSIDLAELPSFDQFGNPIDFGPFKVTFSGVKKNGKTVEATAIVSSFPTVTTFTFRGFANIVSVRWFQRGGGGPGLSTHQFDNIVVRIPGQPAH